MFLIVISMALALGATFGLLIRTELTLPGPTIVSTGHAYNRLFTLHGTIMIFLFIIPSHARLVRQLRAAADARREGRGLPATEPGQFLLLRRPD